MRMCREQVYRTAEHLRRQLEGLINEVRRAGPSPLPSLREIYEELAGLENEFEQVQLDLRRRVISVVTEPIELESVHLGRFEIALEYQRLLEGTAAYEVSSVDETSASADDSVCHPHVRDGCLCEGEAHGPIRAALGSGRMLDFFLVVARTLATYNRDSAFVRLEEWNGVPCADCGYRMAGDDHYSCQACDCDLCCDCGSGCTRCGQINCNECTERCQNCRDACCRGCISSCDSCGENYCENCLDARLCSTCSDRADDGEQVDEANVAAASADPAVHAACLGQTGIPA
jgi:hypothetical protein